LDAGYYQCPALPAFALSSVPPTCTGNYANQNGKIIISGLTNGDRFDISAGSSYLGQGYAVATLMSSVTANELRNNLAGANYTQTYTIRVWNGNAACFTDHTVTMTTPVCGCQELFIDNFNTSVLFTTSTISGTKVAAFPTGNDLGGELDVKHTTTITGSSSDVVRTFANNSLKYLTLHTD